MCVLAHDISLLESHHSHDSHFDVVLTSWRQGWLTQLLNVLINIEWNPVCLCWVNWSHQASLDIDHSAKSDPYWFATNPGCPCVGSHFLDSTTFGVLRLEHCHCQSGKSAGWFVVTFGHLLGTCLSSVLCACGVLGVGRPSISSLLVLAQLQHWPWALPGNLWQAVRVNANELFLRNHCQHYKQSVVFWYCGYLLRALLAGIPQWKRSAG